MTAGEPRVLVHHTAQQGRCLGICALPQRVERAGRRYDRVVVHVEPGGDVGQPIRHAGAAGDAVDYALRLLQHLGDDAFGGAHFPQDVGVDTAHAAGEFVGVAGLRQRALHGVVDQFLVTLPPRATAIVLRNPLALRVEAVGVDRTERADAAGERPVAGRDPVGDGDALATLDDWQHLDPAHANRVDWLHGPRLPRPFDTTVCRPPLVANLMSWPAVCRPSASLSDRPGRDAVPLHRLRKAPPRNSLSQGRGGAANIATRRPRVVRSLRPVRHIPAALAARLDPHGRPGHDHHVPGRRDPAWRRPAR